MIIPCNEEHTLTRYENFKKFDTVVDHSDHHFSAHTSAVTVKKRPKKWVDRINEEWKVLQEHLPDTIFVRAYEDRNDLLRAVIVGQKGTPYQDALFFFDLCFPRDYPYNPPLVSSHSGVLDSSLFVSSHSGVLDIGPNQSARGKVSWFLHITTSILKKMWVPGTSNILQFLVSIQGLVLNAKPLFNGYTLMTDVAGQWWSLLYNENTVIKSLKTMVYTMKRPPKHFESFVDEHFCKRGRDILLACRSYTDGLQVGCLASGKNKTCSIKFQADVTACIKPLVTEFSKRGAKVAFQMKENSKDVGGEEPIIVAPQICQDVGGEERIIVAPQICQYVGGEERVIVAPQIFQDVGGEERVIVAPQICQDAGGEERIIVATNNKRKVVGEEHMDGVAKKNRKVVVGEKVTMTVVEKEKRKVVDENVYLSMLQNNVINHTPSTYTSPSFFMAEKVLVKKGAKVERG